MHVEITDSVEDERDETNSGGNVEAEAEDHVEAVALPDDNDKILICNICDIEFVSRSNLNRHMKAHKNKKETCGICDKAFFTAYDVHAHIQSAHEMVLHNCDQCNKKFRSKSGLKNHQKQHDNIFYICVLIVEGAITIKLILKAINLHMKV
ncbi:KRAB [Mytilus coruscus]|uniref:KRAB n=1 Tax=Mytilus coruscus TaxID=42192 RepID=A0A6J8AVI8_MYTCO|nr:KRAB [Mytilus coruscus]